VSLERAVPPNPYDFLPPRPWFTVVSDDFKDGDRLADRFALANDNDNISPHLRWEGAPEGTKSYVVTCFDPDAPIPSGFWHWCIVDLPAMTTELPQGAGSGGFPLPGAAFHIPDDYGNRRYDGCDPPEGDRDHRYMFAVHAVDTESLEVSRETTPAVVGFKLAFHTLGRGLTTGTWSR
jgi:Raf kinase inhibitor-like YbhB/YbcL family protein